MNANVHQIAQSYRPNGVVLKRHQALKLMRAHHWRHFDTPEVGRGFLARLSWPARARIEVREAGWVMTDTGMTLPTKIHIKWELRRVNDYTVGWYPVCKDLEDAPKKSELLVVLGCWRKHLQFKYKITRDHDDQAVVKVS